MTVHAAGQQQESKGSAPFAAPKGQPVTVELVAEHNSVPHAGKTQLGVLFTIEEGWHIYAQDPGDAGLPTEIVWSLPQDADARIGPLRWPKSQGFRDPGDIKTFGYTGTCFVYASLETMFLIAGPHPSDYNILPERLLPIHAKVKWLACKESCLPGSVALELNVLVTDKPQVKSPYAERFHDDVDGSKKK